MLDLWDERMPPDWQTAYEQLQDRTLLDDIIQVFEFDAKGE